MVLAGDFMWTAEALAFKEASRIEYRGEGQLDKETVKAVINVGAPQKILDLAKMEPRCIVKLNPPPH